CLTEPESRQRPFGFLKVFDCRPDVAEEVVGDAELEVNLLLLWGCGNSESFLECIEDFFEVANLPAALREPFAQPVDHTAFEVFAFEEKCFQIDERFRRRHDSLLQVGSSPDPQGGE